MAQNTKIEWCDHTVNLWWGCQKVHTGCKNCYAENASDVRFNKNLWGDKPRLRVKSAFDDLDKYQKMASDANTILKIFIGSMMDIFEDDKPISNPYISAVDETNHIAHTSSLRQVLFERISAGKYHNLIFLFLTKRPQNILPSIPSAWHNKPPNNVWFGASVSDNSTAHKYIEILNKYSNANLFLSVERQVADIHTVNFGKIKWVIQGGESGKNKRTFELMWAYDMKRMCKEQNVAYFFKQIDKIQPIPTDLKIQQYPKFI